MKHLFTQIVLLFILSGCTANRYYFVMEERVPLYVRQDFTDTPEYEVNVGDTVTLTNSKIMGLGGTTPIEFNDYRFYTHTARARLVNHHKVFFGRYTVRPGSQFITSYSSRNRIANREYSKPFPENKQPKNLTESTGFTPSTGAAIHTGPRGGQYYINSNGNKTYVPRSGGRKH